MKPKYTIKTLFVLTAAASVVAAKVSPSFVAAEPAEIKQNEDGSTGKATPPPTTATDESYSPENVEKAVTKSFPILWKGVEGHSEKRTCFTCHHHGLPLLAFTTARARGFDVGEKQMTKLTDFLRDYLEKNRERMEEGNGPDHPRSGGTDTTAYLFLSLDALGHQPDKLSAAIVRYTLSRDQFPDHWRPKARRPPSEGSTFTSTTLAIAGISKYAGAEQKDDAAKRIDAAREWLMKTPAADTEDRVFRLLGLRAANAAAEDVRKAADELAKSQREDGGWGQLEKMESDAYATGSALYALHTAGEMPTDSAAYRRGLAFLLKTQREDGSWHVKTRSSPIQVYFESGFPYEKDQFISCAATSWATTALALSCPVKKQ